MSKILVRYELRRPVVEELERMVPLVAILIGLVVVLWVRADEVARGFADFWRLDSPELPYDYWWAVWWLAFVWLAVPVVAMVVRVRREPVLTVGTERIEASYSTSSVRGVDTPRVSEIHLTDRDLRFVVPDGLAPRVPVRLLVGATDVQAAVDIAHSLKVPAYRVTGPRRRRRKERLDGTTPSSGIG